MAQKTVLTIVALSAALLAAPAVAQTPGEAVNALPQLAQAAGGFGGATFGQEATDDQLLADVLAALPAGVTLETATDDQIAAAVAAAVVQVTVPGANPVGNGPGGMPTQVQIPGTGGVLRIADATARVLSVLSVTLDSIGRSGSASTVTALVINNAPPQVRSQIQSSVAQSRSNPTPSQVAATAVVISQIQPAAGQQQQQQQPVFQPILPVQQSLGQSVFQENPNQVSPT